MGTRSRVGIKTNEGILVIHVHNSAPASAQEELLNEHYGNLDAAAKLINNGDLSSLSATLDACVPLGYGQYTQEERPALQFKDVAECLANTDAGWVVLYDPETRMWARAGHAAFVHTEEDWEAISSLVAEEISSNSFWVKHPELGSRLFEEATKRYFEERDYGSTVDRARYEASYEVTRLGYMLEQEGA